MPKPKIRHLALFAGDPEKVAKFYQDVFEMELVHHNAGSQAYFLSDGYITLAVLPHTAEGSSTRGLNHFGWKVESNAEIGKKLDGAGLPGPKKRPADRPYAEQRAVDPEGNMFDISEHGFERVESPKDREKQAVGVN